MNAAHFIYIPLVLLIGMVFGWMLGGRAPRGCLRRGTAGAASRKRGSTKSQGTIEGSIDESRTTTPIVNH